MQGLHSAILLNTEWCTETAVDAGLSQGGALHACRLTAWPTAGCPQGAQTDTRGCRQREAEDVAAAARRRRDEEDAEEDRIDAEAAAAAAAAAEVARLAEEERLRVRALPAWSWVRMFDGCLSIHLSGGFLYQQSDCRCACLGHVVACLPISLPASLCLRSSRVEV
jgi:hypothetical protein